MLRNPIPNEQEWLQAGYRYALALTHHREDAEDLVQTACLKLYSRYGRLKQKALLFKTIRNLFCDQCRRANIVVFEALADEHLTVEVVDSGLELQDRAAELKDVLGVLRSQEREVLYLSLVEGYTAREIARLCGYPRNTVLSLLHRGKHKIQVALQQGSVPQDV